MKKKMFPQLAEQSIYFYYLLNKLLCQKPTHPPQVSNGPLLNNWVKTQIPVCSSYSV